MSAFAVIRGELTGRGRTTGRRLNQSASLSPSRPVALCVYLVDKFWRKMTMTTIITRAAVVLVREGDRRPRERQGRFVFTRQEFSGTLVEGRLRPLSSVNHHYRWWIAS